MSSSFNRKRRAVSFSQSIRDEIEELSKPKKYGRDAWDHDVSPNLDVLEICHGEDCDTVDYQI